MHQFLIGEGDDAETTNYQNYMDSEKLDANYYRQEEANASRQIFTRKLLSQFNFVWVLLISLSVTLSYTLTLYYMARDNQRIISANLQTYNSLLRLSLVAALCVNTHQ